MRYSKDRGYGAALIASVASKVPAFGRIMVVVSATDSGDPNYQKLQEIFTPDTDGRACFFNTVEAAYASATTNNNDVILLDGHTTHTVDAMMTVSKNRVNFIGLDGGGRLTAQGAKIQIGVTGVATDLAPVLVTGVRNSFRNIKFINASTTNETLYGFIDNGEGTLIENCSMMKVDGLGDASHAHLWLAGDSLTMRNCVIGQSNNPSSAAGYGILIDAKTGGGSDTVKENFLENIYINMSVANAVAGTSFFLKVADTAALNFGNVIKGFTCTNFIPVGAAAMTDAVTAPAGVVSGSLNISGQTFYGCTGVAAATTSGINIALPGAVAVTAGGLSGVIAD